MAVMRRGSVLLLAWIGGFISSFGIAAELNKERIMNAYDFSFTTLVGQKGLPLTEFKGKVILVVNTASNCGLTPQYAGLEQLYKKYKDEGLVILGVPANDFGHQEPGTNKEISHFCQVNYGVSFPMASKVSVIGEKASPFYQWAAKTLGENYIPKWNFHKYLINRQGKLVGAFDSKITPDAKELKDAIQQALAE